MHQSPKGETIEFLIRISFPLHLQQIFNVDGLEKIGLDSYS